MAVSPRRPKGPPLNALRAFETAARLGGFAAAAEELCVTPGAVAQHIKVLEEWAGADLFERRSQGVRLTAAGAAIAGDFTTAFDKLGEAVQAMRTATVPHQVRIAALPSLAQLWLSPRLPAIRKEFPLLVVSVTATEQPPNLRREPFDLSLFYVDENSVPPQSVKFADDVIYPVCAPALARRLETVSDLAGATFLHDASWPDDWRHWLTHSAPDLPVDTDGPSFSLYALAVEEAVNGAGVLIGHDALVRRQLDAGRLVPLFDTPATLGRKLVLESAHPPGANPLLDAVVAALKETVPG